MSGENMDLLNKILLLSILGIQLTKCYQAGYFKARRKPEFDAMIELGDAVADIKTRSRMTCLSECYYINKCLSFFYNENTGRCVMHSKDFLWQTPTTTKHGWEFYITKDVSGRCPPPNNFYRHLNFCYNVNTISAINSGNIKISCKNKGGKVATITSQEFHDYFTNFLKERQYERVFLAGTVQTDGMIRLDNGTRLTYYNWYNGEPNHNKNTEACLEIYTDNQLFDIPCEWPQPAVYVCEIL